MTEQVGRSLWVAAVILGIVGMTAGSAMAAGPAGDEPAAGFRLAQSVAPAERAPRQGGRWDGSRTSPTVSDGMV
ncbi:MAG TPA: hypothetical protein VMY69_04435, partial [Phycisphaerae bacterium]|nr:hypothetical protein [Phycisphaerae bacterium]